MNPSKSRLFAVAVACLLVASCSHDTSTRPAAGAAGDTHRTDHSQQHWVRDEQLRTVMAELSLRTREPWLRNVPDDPETPSRPREETFRDAASLAEGLASAAARIPESIQNRPMSEADRRGFASEAGNLRHSAQDLKAAAEQRRVEYMQRALDQINFSCIACHSRYRDFAGELNTQRASAN